MHWYVNFFYAVFFCVIGCKNIFAAANERSCSRSSILVESSVDEFNQKEVSQFSPPGTPESAYRIDESHELQVVEDVVVSVKKTRSESYLKKEYELQLLRLKIVLHPLLHGFGEKKEDSFLQKVKAIGSDLASGNGQEAWNKTISDSGVFQTARIVLGGIVGRYAGKEAERVLFHGGFYDRGGSSAQGQSSMDFLLELQGDLKVKFPQWSENTCKDGFLKCSKLGFYSKLFLQKLSFFIENIEEYHKKYEHDFFTKKDVQRIMQFVDAAISRICEENVRGMAIESSEKKMAAINDEPIKKYCVVIDHLLAIPTTVHAIEESWRKNAEKIDELLSFLPNEPQQRDFYDYMQTILKRSTDTSYGHKDGNSGIHLLFAGDTGTGKTFVGKNLPELLGFYPIVMTLEQFKEGQHESHADLEDLIDEPLSGFEQNFLKFDKQSKKPLTVLNQIIFIDEIDEDRDYSVSDIKDWFDQFKKIWLPSLGLHLPGFLHCIFTTNNKKLLRDPALKSRFIQIIFPVMSIDRKIEILLRYLDEKLKQYPEVLKKYKKDAIRTHVIQAVQYNEVINIRILIPSLDSILNYLEIKEKCRTGQFFLISPEDRKKGMESYEQFLERKFTCLKKE